MSSISGDTIVAPVRTAWRYEFRTIAHHALLSFLVRSVVVGNDEHGAPTLVLGFFHEPQRRRVHGRSNPSATGKTLIGNLLLNGPRHGVEVAGKRGDLLAAPVEYPYADAVALTQFLQALASRRSHRLHDGTHAVRKVEEEDQIERLLLAREVYDGLGTLLVEHAEVILGQAGQDSSIKRDFGIHVDQGHAGAEYGSGLRCHRNRAKE